MQQQRADFERQQTEAQHKRQEEEAVQEQQRLQSERMRQEEEATKERERTAAGRKAAEVLRRKVDHLLEVVAAAARGDLTKEVRVEGDEPVDELAASLKKMLADLSGVIGQVTQSASQFTDGARDCR